MIIKIYPENPNPKHIQQVADCLQRGGLIIYPTDTVYGIGCDINNQKAIEKIAKLKGIKVKDANFAMICYDLSHLSDFVKHIETPVYKMLKRALPGPFTFILNANNQVPKLFKNKKKTIGIRIPDNPICLEIVKELNHPILTTSLKDDDEVLEYTTDPELIHERYADSVDIIIDGGYGDNVASTIIDLTTGEPELIRQGKGDYDAIF
mgnify:FL=1